MDTADNNIIRQVRKSKGKNYVNDRSYSRYANKNQKR